MFNCENPKEEEEEVIFENILILVPFVFRRKKKIPIGKGEEENDEMIPKIN